MNSVGDRADTPMKAAFRNWKAHYDRMAEINDEDEFDAAHDRLLEIDEHMHSQPCLTADDVLILLTVQTRAGESLREWRLPDDAWAIIKRALA